MRTWLRFAAKCSDRELTDVTYSAWKIWRNRVQSRNFHYGRHAATLERFPITWNHVIEKESLRFKELEHVLIEKAEQLFRDKL